VVIWIAGCGYTDFVAIADEPNLSIPCGGNAYYLPGTIQLSWVDVEGAASYAIFIDDESMQEEPYDTTSDHTLAVPFDGRDEPYSILIRAENNFEYLKSQQCAITVLPRPEFDETVCGPACGNPVLTWESIADLTQYKVQIFEGTDTTGSLLQSGIVGDLQFTPNPALSEGDYAILLTGIASDTIMSEPSEICQITVTDPAIPNPIPLDNLYSPPAGISPYTEELRWEETNPDVGYEVQLFEGECDSEKPVTGWDTPVTVDPGVTTLSTGEINPNSLTIYSWKIRPRVTPACPDGYWSECNSFCVGSSPCESLSCPFDLYAPAEGSEICNHPDVGTYPNVDLSWAGVATAEYYEVWVSTSEAGGNEWYTTTTTELQTTISANQFGTFYWQVRAMRDGCDGGAWSKSTFISNYWKDTGPNEEYLRAEMVWKGEEVELNMELMFFPDDPAKKRQQIYFLTEDRASTGWVGSDTLTDSTGRTAIAKYYDNWEVYNDPTPNPDCTCPITESGPPDTLIDTAGGYSEIVVVEGEPVHGRYVFYVPFYLNASFSTRPEACVRIYRNGILVQDEQTDEYQNYRHQFEQKDDLAFHNFNFNTDNVWIVADYHTCPETFTHVDNASCPTCEKATFIAPGPYPESTHPLVADGNPDQVCSDNMQVFYAPEAAKGMCITFDDSYSSAISGGFVGLLDPGEIYLYDNDTCTGEWAYYYIHPFYNQSIEIPGNVFCICGEGTALQEIKGWKVDEVKYY